MTFLLLNLLQQRPRISWLVIVGAALAFIAGVSLFVYFYRRYKKIERETEEDWDSSRRSLFVNAPPSKAKVETGAAASVELEAPMAEEAPVQKGGTREFASGVNLASFAPAATVEPEPKVETASLEQPSQPEPAPEPQPEAESQPQPRATEILASPTPTEPVAEAEAEHEAAPFDDEVWAGLEAAEKQAVSEHEIASQAVPPEPLSQARVAQPPAREPFAPPHIERVSHRKPFEPPTIEPLTPREAAATRELRSPQPPGLEPTSDSATKELTAWGALRSGSASKDSPASPSERETRELAGEFVAASPAPQASMLDPSIRTGAARKAKSFGSILDLPADYSHQPLILGEPARPADETGIGALTHYGQDMGPKGGRAGKILLLLVMLLLVGAVAAYFFVPSVHSRVGVFVGRLRGSDAQLAREAIKPKAQLFPSTRPEVNKNMVIARGSVDNISEEPLEKLEVEISLQRGGDAPPEIRRAPVTPDVLQPGERGTYEFEYDGKRDTGFAGYTIPRLFSNGTTEVRFRTPAQK